jgi:hypothetical protein
MPKTCNTKGGNRTKWNRSPGATVWQTGAAHVWQMQNNATLHYSATAAE